MTEIPRYHLTDCVAEAALSGMDFLKRATSDFHDTTQTEIHLLFFLLRPILDTDRLFGASVVFRDPTPIKMLLL